MHQATRLPRSKSAGSSAATHVQQTRTAQTAAPRHRALGAQLPVRVAAPLAVGVANAGPLQAGVVLVILPEYQPGPVERPSARHQAARVGRERAADADLGGEVPVDLAQHAR